MDWLRGGGPLYKRLYGNIKSAILGGVLEGGRKLPSSRDLAAELGISRNVVLLAYEQLLSEGYVETIHGSGTFVLSGLNLSAKTSDGKSDSVQHGRFRPQLSALGRRIRTGIPRAVLRGKDTKLIDFEYHRIKPNRQTMSQFGSALKRAAEKEDQDYPDPRGLPELRRELAGYLVRHKGFRADPADIVIVNGSQQGLDLISRILLEPGDRLLMEDPQYQGARRAFEATGAKIHFVPVDDAGFPTGQLSKLDAGYKLIHLTPAHQFPGGAVLPLGRRLELLNWCRGRNVVILEDDYDGDFRYGTNPIAPLKSLDDEAVVIFLGSFAKTFSPALRFGYLVVPPSLRDAVVGAKHLADIGSPFVVQQAVCDFLRQGIFERHVRRTSRLNRKRHGTLVDALRNTFGDTIRITGDSAGLHLVVWFPGVTGEAASEIIARAEAEGVRVYSLERYYVRPPEQAGIIVGFANLEEAEIQKGVDILGRVVASLQ